MYSSRNPMPLVLIVLIVLLAGPGCSRDLSDAELLERAQAQFDQGKLEGGVIELKNLIQRSPENIEARLLLGDVYLELGDGDSAVKEFDRASELGIAQEVIQPRMAQALVAQGNLDAVLAIDPVPGLSPKDRAIVRAIRSDALINRGQLESAESELKMAAEADSDSQRVAVGWARLELARHDRAGARVRLESLLRQDPSYAPAWSLLGYLEHQESNHQAAENAYTNAIERHRNHSADLFERALLRVQQRNLAAAEEDVANLKHIAPEYPGVPYVEGLIFLAQQNYAGAQGSFEQALNAAGDNPTIGFYLGVAHLYQGHDDQADLYLSRYLAKYPDAAAAQRLLAVLRLRQRNYMEVEKLARGVTGKYPEDVIALNLLATALLGQGRADEAVEILQDTTELKPDSAHAQNLLGAAFFSAGETVLAEAALQSASKIDPNYQPTDVTLVLGYLRNQSLDEAIHAAQVYASKHPDVPLAHDLVGMARLAKGDNEAAKIAFEKALALAPADKPARISLAEIEFKAGRPEASRDHLTAILVQYPDDLATLMRLADLETRMGNWVQLREYLDTAIRVHPHALGPRVRLAGYYMSNGLTEPALQALLEVREQFTQLPGYVAALGEVQLANGQNAEAVASFSRLVELVPSSAQALYLLAKAQSGAGNDAAALRALNDSLSVDPTHYRSHLARARLYIGNRRFSEAESDVVALEVQSKNDADVFLVRGQLESARGNVEKAIAAYSEAFILAPTALTLVALEDVRWNAGDKDRAIREMEAWVEQKPSDLPVVVALAQRYEELKRDHDATRLYLRALEREPESSLLLNNLAWLLRKTEPTRALPYAERAFQLAPDSASVAGTLIEVLLIDRKTKRASMVVEQALKVHPDDADLLYYKARILQESGSEIEAERLLKQILKQSKPFLQRDAAERLRSELARP